jgi:uncharacterized FAD-dependent dehydrogenase
MYRIHQIKLRWDEPLEEIPRKIGKKLGWKGNHPEILEWVIRKESIDARDKSQIFRVYTIDFQPLEPFKQGKDGLVELVKEDPWMPPPYGEKQLEHSPVIVGFGPAGMFAALVLSEAGFHPVILERGASMEDRIHKVNQFWRDGILDEETNVQFGEGGAGTFSDGKLTTGIRDVRIQKVFKELVEAGANPNILYKQKPHVGTDVLRKVVVEIREKIKRAGGSFQFQTKLTDLVFEEGRIMGVQMGEKGTIPTESLVLAIGHSARDTQELLHSRGLAMEQKPFSMGLRIEHPQSLIDESQFGNVPTAALGPAEYKLVYRGSSGRGVYTFCMCPGGQVILASSEKESLVTNGMSNHDRSSGKANSALLVEVGPTDFPSSHPLAGVWWQREVEKKAFQQSGNQYRYLTCSVEEFVENKGAGNKVRGCFPEFIGDHLVEALPFMSKKIQGFDGPKARLYGVETRSSSPIRIRRDETYQSNIEGLYPTGEGAGYAGGIMSAAVDGIRVAEQIMKTYYI